MLYTFSTLRFYWLTAIYSILALCASAQIQVTFPSERAIFQRQADGAANVSVSGVYTSELDKIEARALPINSAQGKEVPWTTLESNPKGGVFTGSLPIPGGWYSLEVRGALAGKVSGTDKISKMGVGEVFIISGQSNAQGVDIRKEFPLPPGANDDRVNYINYNNDSQNSLNDPPAAVFEQLQLQDSVHILGPIGRTAWCWGILGDLLAKKLNVPILFINTAWSGTSIQNWVLSSQGRPTTSVYSDTYYFPEQMPYGNLRMAVQHYASQYGARTILWMLGESDNFPVRMGFNEFKSDLEALIRKLSSDTNAKIPWVVSRTSRIADNKGVSITSPDIIAAQNAVIRDLSDFTFGGPETDDLPITRVDGTHFYGNEALNVLANAWNDVLSESFLKGITPIKSNPIPKVTINCEPGNNSVSLSLPEQYNNYVWTIEQNGNVREESGKSLLVSSPGTFSAKVKDQFGNTIRTQRIVINSRIKPAAPDLSRAGLIQVCADSTIVLHVNAGDERYRWYHAGGTEPIKTGSTIEVKETGDFVVRGENVLGCFSDDSRPVSVVVQKEVARPEIEKIGPFNIRVIADHSDPNASVIWTRDQEILTTHRDTLQTDVPGSYSARVGKTFTIEDNSLTCFSDASNEILIGSEQVSNVVVFPNPAYDSDIYIESKEDMNEAELMVYDVFGRVLFSQKQVAGRRARIPVRGLSSGRYIIRIKSAQMDISKHIIVK
ncbi:sialate O-acetylesterase [Dyadobacter sp. CY323]|uniref:sialate O-acetylesterase n=1 Tax=Dyadobacter sp. CY323 TaxID=2907302 RepID=UPI001F3DA531|nr:sialate O-acetylesterase [Dyadobacter sp. CY323]MCE6987942.1 T9SS type A sorting domain-containing protein [Dyadobacter sp. CY323]